MVFSLSMSLTGNVHVLKKMFVYSFKLHIISDSCSVFIGKGEDQHKASHMFTEVKEKVVQSRPTLCDPMECSLPGSSALVSLIYFKISSLFFSTVCLYFFALFI